MPYVLEQSEAAFRQLQRRIPGGVNSPFRAFSQVGGSPPVLVRGHGAYVWDADGNQYLDFCCAWGPILLGHSHPKVVEAAKQALDEGAIFGAPTPWESEFAALIQEAFPSMEQLRLVNSGAEAVGSALRVARGFTRKPRIVKFEGCYHGHVECLDSSGVEAPDPIALGASPGSAAETLVCDWGDLDGLDQLLQRDDVAAVILEPVPGSMTVIDPGSFLRQVRELCDKNNTLLIFDEVLTGFRIAFGGAQERYRVKADLTCLGKALAGGMAVGAYGGRKDLMSVVAPLGQVYQAGTFCGNPVTVRAGIACLNELMQPGRYARLEALTERLKTGLQGSEVVVQAVCGMFSLSYGQVRDHHDLAKLDVERFARLFHRLLELGFYLPPSCTDAAAICLAHTPEHIDRLVEAVKGTGQK